MKADEVLKLLEKHEAQCDKRYAEIQDKLKSLDGRVWGSYLHGLFDDNQFRRQFLDHHRSKNGKRPLQKVVYEYDTDKAIANLAQIVRRSTDLERIYGDLNL